MKKILVTGGAGYIGSHTVVELISAGYTPVIVDNFSNSEPWILDRIAQISGVTPSFYEGDCTDADFMDSVFLKEGDIDAVIHFAASKAVNESVREPLQYYKNNVGATVTVLESMRTHDVNKIVFSSSATVYGEAKVNPITEQEVLKSATSPYGSTKIICENIIEDVTKSTEIKGVSLRYFNPIGAHPSGLLGELPKGEPNNLVPFVTQSAASVRGPLRIFGNDYPTPDGTCVRDYIHVVDLALAHIASLRHLQIDATPAYDVFNVGTGTGVSVLELVTLFEKVNDLKVDYSFCARREGDVAVCYADVQKNRKIMKWRTLFSLEDSLRHAWLWQKSLVDL